MSLRSDILNCARCALRDGARTPVPPTGTPGLIALVGEAPGRTEDQQAEPFVGPSGQLLRRLIADSTPITDPYLITGLVSCWPGEGNPDPPAFARAACRPFLLRALAPARVVVTLGAVALSAFSDTRKVGRDHGVPFRSGPWVIMPTYHPAAALRTPGLADEIALDLAMAYGLSRNPQEWPSPPDIQYTIGFDSGRR